MNFVSTLYPSAPLNAAHAETLNGDLANSGLEEKDPERFGYFLIDGLLVPFLFLEKLRHELTGSISFEPDWVLSATHIFNTEFLESLDPLELKVLMPCVLMVIESGEFPVNFFAEI